MQYCEFIYQTKKRITREVKIGSVGVGGNNPVRIQSMTTSPTKDVEATIEQAIRLYEAGCEIVRVTVQGMKEADSCEKIKDGLIKKGLDIPLVADIHFFPPAAMRVLDFVDKVRINPGNYVDKRASFKILEYTDASYLEELNRLEDKFTPLVEKCKRLKKSLRIGTNHGSLSDRIMNRYGDTPQGMVESAMEFTRICQKNDFHDIIFSMKASNPQVMIQAYRLLLAEMYRLKMDYPLHLGVTEAGMGEDGRVKSAMGIGALLLDGVGDTIRVSLTEDPWKEIEPCKKIIQFAENYVGKGVSSFEEKYRRVELPKKRTVIFPNNVSMHRNGTVIVSVNNSDLQAPQFFSDIGCKEDLQKLKIQITTVDNIVLRDLLLSEKDKTILKKLHSAGIGIMSSHAIENGIRTMTLKAAKEDFDAKQQKQRFSLPLINAVKEPLAIEIANEKESEWNALENLKPSLIFLKPKENRLHSCRKFFEWLQEKNLQIPVILNFSYECSLEDLTYQASAECGALFCDGLGEGLYLEGAYSTDVLRTLSFNILQAARMRTSKTDFISCPSCGRTLFDLQDVTKRIQARTAHLPGVKIAIMGCIVNGPGEMADADFGYVGSKPGKIDLYVGKSCVEKDIDFADADDRLVDLIKAHGRWIDLEVEC